MEGAVPKYRYGGGRGVAHERGRGVAHERGRGAAHERGRGVAHERGRGAAHERGRGVAHERGRGAAHERGRGVAHERGRGAAHERGRGVAHERGRGRGATYNSHWGANGGDRSGSGRGRQHGPVEPIDMLYLDTLAEEDPEQILLTLNSASSGFTERIGRQCTGSHVGQLLKVIAKGCTVRHSPGNMNQMLIKVNYSGFLLASVIPFVTSMLTRIGGPDTGACWDICKLVRGLLRCIPSASTGSVTAILAQLTSLPRLPAELREELGALEEMQKDVVRQIQGGELLRDGENADDEGGLGRPPDDFRQLSVIPTPGDLQADVEPYLPKNRVFGQYKDVDEYVDTHFRLLREDFMEPLRNGIRELLRNDKKSLNSKYMQDVRVYTGVHIVMPHCSRSGLLMRLHFDTKSLTKVNWRVSKRLINGSLVCLSSDSFKSFVIGTVSNRDTNDLMKGQVDVQLADVQNIDPNPYIEYEMIESQAYFEAYRHNLEGLQEIDDASLPFQPYILKAKTDMEPPAYLRGQDVSYDLSPLVQTGNLARFKRVPVLDNKSWPSADDMKLDQSQYQALKTAVTSEFSAIQGPPGTGKTFIGLKIMELLLHNIQAWSGTRIGNYTSCILVICYTNHALDQFVEGILQKNEARHKLIRLGGRSSSRNDLLQKCLLYNVKRDMDIPVGLTRLKGEIFDNMHHIEDRMAFFLKQLLDLRSQIIAPILLAQVMTPNHQMSMFQGRQDAWQTLCEWLFANTNINDQGRTQGGQDAANAEEVEGDYMEDPELERITADRDILTGMSEREDGREQIGAKTKNLLQAALGALQKPSAHRRRRKPEEGEWQTVSDQRKHKHVFQKELRGLEQMDDQEAYAVQNVWALEHADRWRLYRHWVAMLCEGLLVRIQALGEEFNDAAKQLHEAEAETDLHAMRTATILAMTTTGAAKYRHILQRIKPRIVIVEEAAEVLESHIITSLSSECQHLILIGDHQQLRPNPTVYRLAKDYHLDISLFERMVKNDLQCERLVIQHRMRPEIVKLIVPHVYKSLQNDACVLKYDHVRGIGGDVFFINHIEDENNVEDTRSRSNSHEADLMISLCKYLLQQGYGPEDITILTTYTGQMFEIRKKIQRSDAGMDAVKVTPVDNYQGEENDIILLSLVRSNKEGKIGFLNISNRVCVALSRAKKGFYALGNMKMLRAASRLWDSICKDIEKSGMLVESIPLQCQLHPDTVVQVSCAADFSEAPEGGCTRPCEARLDCGHVCQLRCHPWDQAHETYKCMKLCERTFSGCDHICQKLCHEDCGKCPVKVKKIMPKCGHEQTMKCSVAPEKFMCKAPCKEMLACGHFCSMHCGQDCITTEQCDEVVAEREWPCGHTLSIACRNNPRNFKCPEPVTKKLTCGHVVSTECSTPTHGLHCKELVKTPMKCGHEATLECHKVSKFKCDVEVEVQMCPRGCKGKVPCHDRNGFRKPCENIIPKVCATNDKHQFMAICHTYEKARCTTTCPIKLACGHTRIAKCGEKDEHIVCGEPCRRSLPCGHRCKGKCGEPCKPCADRSSVYCGHTPFRRPCKDSCWQCTMGCGNACEHSHCTRRCDEPCDRSPCELQCKRLLRCGHRCPGFCGELCPTICLKCHPRIYQQMYNKLEVTPGRMDKVVVVQPCGHVISAPYMDRMVNRYLAARPPKELQLLSCPICESPVYYCPRYKNAILSSVSALVDINRELKFRYHAFAALSSWGRKNNETTEGTILAKDLLGLIAGSQSEVARQYYQKCLGCLFLAAAAETLKQSSTNNAKNEVAELSHLSHNRNDVSVQKTVDEAKRGFFVAHIDVMLVKVKSRFKQRELHSIIFGSMSPLSDVNARIKAVLPVHLRNGVEDFIEELNRYMTITANSPAARWIVCGEGHVSSYAREVSVETAAGQCPRCRLDDDDDDIRVHMSDDDDDDDEDNRVHMSDDDDDLGYWRILRLLGK